MFVTKLHQFIFLSAIIVIAACFSLVAIPKLALAAAFSVTPQVFDEQAHGRDIIKDHITLHNNSGRTLFIFTGVNDISDTKGTQRFIDPSLADRSSSLASWVWISRSLQMVPGETKTLDLRVEVNLNAKPGAYHAQITFTEGNTQAEAESNKTNGVTAQLNVTVQDSSREQSDLLRFVPEKSVFLKSQASFSYTLKNSGDVALTPTGEISIYNRGGEEVATLPVNQQNNTIAPGNTVTLHSTWEPASGFGRYKAIIRLKYGEKQPQILTDVVFFTLLPWPLLLVIIGALFLIVFTLLYLINRHETQRRLKHEARYEQLLAVVRTNGRKRVSATKRRPAKSKRNAV